MIVHYIAPSGAVLQVRPQDAVPAKGQRVTQHDVEGVLQAYRVVDVEWPLTARKQDYYSIYDASEHIVRVLLKDEGPP